MGLGRWRCVILAVVAFAAPTAASAACTAISTPQQLNNIRNNLTRQYCLANDIDLRGIANFMPIGDGASPFAGQLDGRGHTILNLRIRSNNGGVGLFGAIDGGVVRNLRLAGLDIRSQADTVFAGGVVGWFINGSINNVTTAGTVSCPGTCRAGGIAGQTFPDATIVASSSAANVTSGNGGAAGGVTGQNNGRLTDVYATGRVKCGNNCATGGLTGHAETDGTISRAFASGVVTANRDGSAGGLVGVGNGKIIDAYATGAVTVNNQGAGGLVGVSGNNVTRVFSAGRISFGAMGFGGGLMATAFNPVTNAYWDATTSTMATSDEGTAQTTTQLRATLPAGFGAAWSITEGVTYPFLTSDKIGFKSTLATLVSQDLIFTFAPISQLEQPEYDNPASNAQRASLAAVFGMIARAAGNAWSDARLIDVKLDRYFWTDSTAQASWTGPVRLYVTLGPLSSLAAADPLDESNVVGALRAGQLVILRGSYRDGAARRPHWMLATSFTEVNGNLSRVVANDPWTGRQVLINPTTKRVISPAGFPLAGFTIDGYRPATLQ